MDFRSYCTTVLLIITFIFTHSDQVKAAAEIQNTCKNKFLEGKNAIFKQSPTSAPIIRDTTKWKLNRIVHFRPKAIENMFFTTTPSTIPTTYSTLKLPLINNMIDSNYWNYPGGHFNVLEIGKFRDAKKNSPNNLYNKNTMPEIHFVSRIQKTSFNDGIMTTASDRLNSLPLERMKNIDFDYEDHVYDDLKNNNNKPLESKQFARPNNCSESKGTKVLIANFPFKPQNERNPFGRKAYPLLKDTFLDLYYWLSDEFKQEITTNPPVILQVEAQTPDSYTTKVFSPTNSNNIENSTNFLDLVLTLDNFSTSTKDEFYPDYLTEDVLKTVKTISLYPESSKLTNTQQEESHSPQIQTTAIFNNSKPSILSKGNEYLNKYKLDISHNETKFNKRSLEKFDPLEAAQVSLLPDMSTAESGFTVQDKIKFFEMYDDHTLNDSEFLSFENKSYENLLTSSLKSRNISSLKEQNIKREIEVSNVNLDNSTSFVEPDNKSLNDDFNQTLASTANEHELITTKMHQNRTESLITTTKAVTSEASKENFRITKKPPTNFGNRYNNKRYSAKTIFDVSTKKHKPKAEIKLHRSFAASWYKYPYAAAYIHEPLQIHCDAASISAHWLIAAASCMSRMYAMHNDPLEGRSAYVTYCSNEWWNPQLIAYVKYSVMHPNFNRRNSVKRILYNIGLIRVVNSMTANCPAWRPVPLSHRIMTQLEEVEGVTVGWGLDRLTRTQFDAVIRVQKPLSVYTGLVFSNICPGKQKNGKPKSAEEELALKNVFCITLPPYNGEALDPTHGSLLLVQNKLVGLYLQEERRVFGAQSAQYTSIWRLLPWIFENAKEPEIGDNFSFDIL